MAGEQHDPLTALSGVSFALHGLEPVAGRCRARLVDGGGFLFA